MKVVIEMGYIGLIFVQQHQFDTKTIFNKSVTGCPVSDTEWHVICISPEMDYVLIMIMIMYV